MDFTALLPHQDLTISTRLSEREVLDRLESVITAGRGSAFLGKVGPKPYQGVLQGDSFRITRINYSYKNPYMPIIEGKVAADGGGTRVLIHMKLDPGSILFMLVFLIAFAIIFGMGISSLATLAGAADPTTILYLVILAGIICLTLLLPGFAFRYEARISRLFLTRLLEGE